MSIIPKDALHRKKNDVVATSPKISCMGRIKPKKKEVASGADPPRKEKAHKERRRRIVCPCGVSFPRHRRRASGKPDRAAETEAEAAEVEAEKKKERRRHASVAAAPVPTLGQMRWYASGRETLAGFDWRKEMDGRNSEEENNDEVLVPHSAPILVCAGEVVVEPKKEVNLWRRRAMPPPTPLGVEKK